MKSNKNDSFEEYVAKVRQTAKDLVALFGYDDNSPEYQNDAFFEDLWLLANPEGDAWTDDDLKPHWMNWKKFAAFLSVAKKLKQIVPNN